MKIVFGIVCGIGIMLVLRIVRQRLKGKLLFTNIETITVDGIIKFESKKTSHFRQWTESLDGLLARTKLPLALIVRINSPGGTVGASQELYRRLQKVRSKGIKVVALMEDVAASGGLYIAMAADYIVANAGSLTGSIGVVVQSFEYGKILEALEVKARTIKSGEFKDLMSPVREMTPADHEILQGVVQDAYGQFVEAVSQGRRIPTARVMAFADGRIFTGSQAKELGLVDELGGFDDALEAAKRLASIPEGKERVGSLAAKKSSLLESLTDKLAAHGFVSSLAVRAELSGLPLWLMPKL